VVHLPPPPHTSSGVELRSWCSCFCTSGAWDSGNARLTLAGLVGFRALIDLWRALMSWSIAFYKCGMMVPKGISWQHGAAALPGRVRD
jgi:hypothetical protein